ncbi:hypothetical protein ANCDUO_13482, partial [Ancylostoma duodenale]
LWPATACAVFCTTLFGGEVCNLDPSAHALSVFLVGVAGSLYTDYVPTELELKRTFFARYGSSHFTCNPLFFSYVLRAEYEELPFFFRVSIELVPMLTTIEVITMAMFSIITVHSDFPDGNGLCILLLGTTVLPTPPLCHLLPNLLFIQIMDKNKRALRPLVFSYVLRAEYEELPFFFRVSIELVPMLTTIEVITMAMFSIITVHSDFPVPRIYAFMEYVMIVSYGIFHTTSLIDIRHISFMCYPRTCSGECEPLDPVNFAKDAKYEHCRAFEYQQRRTHIL